jgi:hypothetical protein
VEIGANRSYNLHAEPLLGLAAPADFSFVFAGLCSSIVPPALRRR